MATPKASESPSYCRCCLADGSDLLFDVFVILEEFKYSIRDLVAGCCGIIISEQDEGSKNICGVCLQDLCNTYRFRNRCLRINSTLRETPTMSGSGGAAVIGDPESMNNKKPPVSCEVKQKKPPVSTQEKATQTEGLEVEMKCIKLERAFTCFTCRATFQDQRVLKDHVRVHRCPYECNICLKRFKQAEDLVVHRGTHYSNGLSWENYYEFDRFERRRQRRR